MSKHIPVMLHESIIALDIIPNGFYIDCTYGRGGHSKEILKKLENGFLYGFDQDIDAINNTIESDNFKLIRSNFRFVKNFLKLEGVQK